MKKRKAPAYRTYPTVPRRWTRWAATIPGMCLIVFVFSVLLYINTLGNEFVWDDRTLVVENADIRTLDWPTVGRLFTTHYWEITGKPGGLYRPLSALSFYLDYRLYGKDPRGYHLTNVILNGLVCLLAFLFILQLFGSKLTATRANGIAVSKRANAKPVR